jgi:hypothetical protein
LSPRALRSENDLGGPIASRVAGLIFSAESAFVCGADLPIGVSLACVTRAPGSLRKLGDEEVDSANNWRGLGFDPSTPA